jgi:hypothetical protein
MATKSQAILTLALKVNISKLRTLFLKDQPLINDLVYAGVSQFLGIKNGPIELELPGMTSMPNMAMLQFLQDMEILVPEAEEVGALNS